MNTADYLSLASFGFAVFAAGAVKIETLPWFKKHPEAQAWLSEAAAIAGKLRLELPPGTTLAQAKSVAENEGAALAAKYPGAVTQAQATLNILGTLGTIVEDGHILPPSVAPAATEIQLLISKVDAVLATLPAPVVAPATPAVAAAA